LGYGSGIGGWGQFARALERDPRYAAPEIPAKKINNQTIFFIAIPPFYFPF
jgi:hypothetical protein